MDSYAFIREHVKSGEQVYIITPLIELSETIVSAKAAVDEFNTLQKQIFPELRLGLLHGRLSSKDKDAVLNDFRDHNIDILVSTTVVEVGVDVPNATIMVIETAERFGLAQLHQLRGRVGRGEKQSFCFLFAGDEKAETITRLRNLETIDNGLKLAELDLQIRGSGEITGTAQSGRFEMKIATFSDLELIEKARNSAKTLLDQDAELNSYPLIKEKLNQNTAIVMPD
jgi:ATP-dependent DNA helicase RecG